MIDEILVLNGQVFVHKEFFSMVVSMHTMVGQRWLWHVAIHNTPFTAHHRSPLQPAASNTGSAPSYRYQCHRNRGSAPEVFMF